MRKTFVVGKLLGDYTRILLLEGSLREPVVKGPTRNTQAAESVELALADPDTVH
jgi:hypothetical protein